MNNIQKLTAALWTYNHMRRSAFFPSRPAGRTDNGNHLESGEIRGNMQVGLSDEWRKTLWLIWAKKMKSLRFT